MSYWWDLMKTIVVVDDSSFCRELLALALRKAGYEVITAAVGLDAMPQMLRDKPDLVLLDLRLPDMDGLKTLRIIRSSPSLKNVPVFILSEEEHRACIVQATQIGIQAYILKSQFVLDKFLQRVQSQIGVGVVHRPMMAPATSPTSAAIAEIWGQIE